MTRAAVKKHLTILHEGNLISVQIQGRSRLNSLNTDGLQQLMSWFDFFDTFWDERLNTLKTEPAQVWAYLTDPEKLAIWFHKPKSALVEGEYEMFGIESGDRLMWGEVLVAKPFTQLEYTFAIAPSHSLNIHLRLPRWATNPAPSNGA